MSETNTPQAEAANTSRQPLRYAALSIGWGVTRLAIYTTILGFLIVLFDLVQLHAPFYYNINPLVFIVKGAAFLVLFVVDCFAVIIAFYPVILATIFVLLVFAVVRNQRKPRSLRKNVFRVFISTFRAILRYLFSHPLPGILFYGIALIMAINPNNLFSFLGSSTQRIPIAELVFNQNSDPTILNLSTDPSEPRRTQPLHIIVEYTDGLLVKDDGTGRVVMVENNVLSGIIYITPTPTSQPTPTITQ